MCSLLLEIKCSSSLLELFDMDEVSDVSLTMMHGHGHRHGHGNSKKMGIGNSKKFKARHNSYTWNDLSLVAFECPH